MYSFSNSIWVLSYLSYSSSTAILVHDACTLADTTVGLANVVKTALFQPRKTQNGVLGHTARVGGATALVC
jgi:hypothetical protein